MCLYRFRSNAGKGTLLYTGASVDHNGISPRLYCVLSSMILLICMYVCMYVFFKFYVCLFLLNGRINKLNYHIYHVSSHLSTLACFVPISLSMPIQIDILINNSGRSQHSLSLETSVDVYQVLMEHNFLGTVSFTKQVLPHMMQRGSCSVVTVSSTPGNYVHHLDTYFEADFPRILISTVCPGPVLSQSRTLSQRKCERWQTILLFNYVWQYALIWAWFITDVLGRKRVQNFKVGLVCIGLL
uniref:Uncharacterized protein n=1 Tax=Oncorhynchus tshawytscha TaxID=74940 RepID=A0A8C8HJG5_ONCTS